MHVRAIWKVIIPSCLSFLCQRLLLLQQGQLSGWHIMCSVHSLSHQFQLTLLTAWAEHVDVPSLLDIAAVVKVLISSNGWEPNLTVTEIKALNPHTRTPTPAHAGCWGLLLHCFPIAHLRGEEEEPSGFQCLCVSTDNPSNHERARHT